MLFSEDYSGIGAEELCGMIGERRRKAGFRSMVVTMGEQGAVYSDESGDGICPPQKTDVIDTTGAGDAFFAGVAAGLTYGKCLSEACAIGTRLASAVISTKESCCPNNCWGGSEASAELCNNPWDFNIYTGQSGHALYQGIVTGPDANKVYCTDKGYHITNSTAQYHIGADWGGYENHDFWQTETGGTIVGVGGDGAVVVWEAPASNGNFGKGGIICFGSGCYDWYSPNPYTPFYHDNVGIMTGNAFKYLSGK
jgi:hypothetical protein